MRLTKKVFYLILISISIIIVPIADTLYLSAREIPVRITRGAHIQHIDFGTQGSVVIEKQLFVPVRAVFEALEFEVEWDQYLQAVTLSNFDYTFVITVESYTFILNGEERELATPARIIGDRVLMPINEILRSINLHLNWQYGLGSAQILISIYNFTTTDFFGRWHALSYEEWITYREVVRQQTVSEEFGEDSGVYLEFFDDGTAIFRRYGQSEEVMNWRRDGVFLYFENAESLGHYRWHTALWSDAILGNYEIDMGSLHSFWDDEGDRGLVTVQERWIFINPEVNF